MKRLNPQSCERIERDQPVSFHWQGEIYQGYAGDTLASALLANGISVLGRSFKYGRQRGVMAAGAEEPNALVTLESGAYQVPNARSTEVKLYENLQAKPASGIPNLRHDLRAWLKPFHYFMPAGFYYKTFKWPQKLWPWYERSLRQLAGFSEVPSEPDAEHYDHVYHKLDVVVVGAGPAGMAAALAAADSGARVLLIDERHAMGGEIISDCVRDENAKQWFKYAQREIAEHENITLLLRTTAYALHDYNLLLALESCQDHVPLAQRNPKAARQCVHRIRAAQVILATGSHERPLMFANNDLPGVMLASAVRRYLNEYAVLCGEKIVIAGNNDSIYELARDLLAADIRATVIDSRTGYNAADLIKAGVDVRQGWQVIKATGFDRVSQVQIAACSLEDGAWTLAKPVRSLDCDLLAVSGGFNPLVHLDCHTGSKPVFSAKYQAFMPSCDKPNRWVAGSVNGHSEWQGSVAEGTYAGLSAVQALGKSTRSSQITANEHPEPLNLKVAPFWCPDEQRHKTFLDLQNDVKVSDIELAISENYRSIEHIKRYTALGFGTDQGKTANVNGIAVAAAIMNQPIETIGTTTFRPMYTPVTMGALAGEERGLLFDPQRFTPMHASHVAKGAEFELVGQWLRPWYFPKVKEDMHQAVQRESLVARRGLAMIDASTLGKIDIQGPDAREFLNRVYTNAWLKLAPGKCRYGLMCDENGMIIDDGVTACLDENHFLMTTTTGGAARIYTHLETWLQTEWPTLEVYLTSVTDHWSTTAVVGPKARRLMEMICDDIDFSVENFKFMDWRAGTVLGVPARVMRISFSGELSYEINVQANYGRYIWDKVMEIGQQWGITPYGTETMHVLRAEKGFIIVGQDTDGSITPYDANMAWAVKLGKAYPFLGERSLTRSDTQRPNRKQLVGLLTADPQVVLREGCQLVNAEDDTVMLGHVTSSYMSPTLGHSIAMAVVKGGLDRLGDTLYAKPITGEVIPVTIADAVFYDQAKEKNDGEA